MTLKPGKPISFDEKRADVTENSILWDKLPVEGLIRHRDEIMQALQKRGVALSLKDISMEQELLLQLHTLRALQAKVMDEEGVPFNQIAQVANTLGATLSKVAEMQLTVYDSERFKQIESALIRALRYLPEAACESFLADYARIIGAK